MKNLFSGFGRSDRTRNSRMMADAKKDETQAGDDIELLHAISMGDRSAFSRFRSQYAKLLFSIARRILNDKKVSEDVLQEVFREIWDKAGSYNSGLGKPVSWAVAMVRNKAMEFTRSQEGRTLRMYPRKLGLVDYINGRATI